ncbi:ComEA family DNA-binding protein [Pseudomonas sp. PGPR81]|uniref:ComEA family DNA-binding protein n=1 Tax=unclassified Pseudomonas TaxID=196821 RepID=UPI000E6A9D00|nr:helix-hairpin-helix domain-containing protein [Pseudomonas sp. PGPR81]
MRNIVLSYLVLSLFGALPLTLNAAPASATPPAAISASKADDLQGPSGKIDLNNADALALQKLNGIGKAKAEAIVAYREANGPFESVDELLEIKGIGNALLERNRDKLVVE